jgi:phosphatidylserine decarboxylase
MKLTPYGKRELGVAGLSAAIISLAGALNHACWPLAGSCLALLGVGAFFRDPCRRVTDEPGAFLAPADGLVDDIERLADGEACDLMGGGPVHRIGIFLSVFDVHLNRAPCDMAVLRDAHRPGQYLDARDGRCARLNEAHSIVGTAGPEWGGGPVMVRQISGLIARRIVCDAVPGSSLKRGERYGMIKFGSRTELYIPATPGLSVAVKTGTRVRGGITILARFAPSPDR